MMAKFDVRVALKYSKLKGKGDEFDLRKYDPTTYGFQEGALPRQVLVSDPDCCELVHLKKCIGYMWCIALYADGACSGNGTPVARASMGVYGTPGAWYNFGARLPMNLPQTSQNAEIHSAIAAIKIAREIMGLHRPYLGVNGCPCFSTVVVVMDSSYVVKAMTEWIRKWRVNGFFNSRGIPVVNSESFQRLDNDIRQIFMEKGVIIRFWHVSRIYNAGADEMAAEALRELST